jgi:hypothetical protein
MLTTKDLLTALLGAISAVRVGPQEVSPGQPVRVHLVPPVGDLQVPALLQGAVDLTFLTKSDRFADALGVPAPDANSSPDLPGYLGDPNKVVGGQPIADVDVPLSGPPLKGGALPVSVAGANPADLGTLPSLEEPASSAANALSGVPGLLGQLVGTIPVPVMAPVQVAVTWTVLKDGTEVASSATTWEMLGSGSDVQFVFAQVFAELTNAGPTLAHYEIIASVTLSVGSDSAGPVPLQPVPVDIPTVGIPSIAALFDTTQFGGANPGADDDKAVMLLVPSNSPLASTRDANAAWQQLNGLIGTVTSAINAVLLSPLTSAATAAELALFLAGLGRLGSAVQAYVGGTAKWPLQIVIGDGDDGVGDLSDVKYDEGVITDRFDNFDDSVYSLILVAVPAVQLLLGTDDSYKGTTLTVTPGPEMVIGVPTFDQGHLGDVIPAGITGTAVVNGDSEDVEDGNFESVRFLRS